MFENCYQIYIQLNKLGMASYYLSNSYDSYISYVDTPWKLDDGTSPPEKKYFNNAQFSSDYREFTGVIEWETVSFYNAVKWEYKMIFSNDWESIEGGTITCTYSHGNKIIKYFGQDLLYKKIFNPNANSAIFEAED